MAFPENATIGELLLVAKNRIPRDSDVTKLVKMLRKPKTAAQGYLIGESILRGDERADYRMAPITHGGGRLVPHPDRQNRVR